MRVVHLEHGLGTVVRLKDTAGMVSAIIELDHERREVWVPVTNASEHVRAVPTPSEAAAWRSRAMTRPVVPPAIGDTAARRRERTLDHRDLARQLDALAEAYQCGDQGLPAQRTLEDLEDRVLPVIAEALATTIDALRAELRAAMAHAPAPRAESAPALDARFALIGDATFEDTTLYGDPGSEKELSTLAGRWFGYAWTHDGDVDTQQLVAIHADHIAAWRALLAEASGAAEVGRAGSDCSQALIYAPSLLDDPQDLDEVWNPVSYGLLAKKGFAHNLRSHGYPVRVARRGDRVVCILTGEDLEPAARAAMRP